MGLKGKNEPTSMVPAASAWNSREQGRSVLSGAALRGSLQRKDLAPGASPRTETSGNLRSSKKGIPGSGKSGQRNRKGSF